MATPMYDESRWPLLIVRLPGRLMSDDELEEHFAQLDAYLSRSTPCILIFEEGSGPSMTPSQRRRVAARMKRDLSTRPGIVAGIGHVGVSPTARSLASAIAWLVATPYPIRSFSDRSSAVAWGIRRLAEVDSKKRVE